MIEKVRVFESFAEAADCAKERARNRGICVPITRSGDLWYVGEVHIDGHAHREEEFDSDDYISDEEWIARIRWGHLKYKLMQPTTDWSSTGDDMNERDYELYFGGPEDED